MDKWLDNRWFLRGVSLLLAFLLFSSVPITNSNKSGNINVPSNEDTEVITEVPVNSYYDSENLVVTGIPETVDVRIQGPRNIVQQARALRDFEVYVDLTELEMGEHQIQINIRDISERLTVTIDPSNITVNIQERVTRDFKVSAEFNSGMIADGYVAGSPSIEPDTVQVTGAKNVIDQIGYVKANVNIGEETKDTVTTKADVLVLDKDMNKLDVTVEPSTVDVTIPIESSSKKVPLDIVPKGNPPEGVTIDSITSDVNEATIIANPEVLEDVKKVRVEVDVSNITEDTEVTLPIIISNGVVEVSPETAKLTIKVKKQEEVTLSNIPITVSGQTEDQNINFRDPENGRTSVIATGQAELVNGLTVGDFELLIDVSGLLEGDHSVDISVSAPNNISWKLASQKANITISKKET
ncbi:YbbR domain-containing protein [Mesobacillus persicus]|uniref:YbbR domain-containing protein n=1 Tax=Mesobacillus persicus TaxID=930146 RepID=A0A1H8KED7_9BACI|nr:CdaR family protein [Mesobacillus persicus]SEN91031.1 YbbR domain-containing protein [Mesobacillus persicus]